MTLISPTLRNVCNDSLRRLNSLRVCGHLSYASAAASLHRCTPCCKPLLITGAPKATCNLCSERLIRSEVLSYRNPCRPSRMAMTTTMSAATAIDAGTDADAYAMTAAHSAAHATTASPSKGLLTEMPPGMSEEAALLSAFSEVPSISRVVVRVAAAAAIAPGAPVTVTITTTLQQRNLPGNAQRRYNITAALPANGRTTGETGPVHALVGLPQELHADTQMVSVSPSGRQQLVVLKGPNDSTSALLQIWRGARMIMELAIPKTLHGPLVNDGYFASGAAWTADESAVVYTAETPPAERTPAWSGPESLKDAAGPRSWRGVGAAVEDWGELNTGKRPPAPYVLDLERREVLQVPGLPAENSVGQPTWCPPQSASSATDATTTNTTTGGGPNGLLVVAWPHSAPPSFPRLAASANPRKLGVVFCYNRSARLYHVSVRRGADGALQFGPSAIRLAPSLESCLSPTFSPGGEALLLVSHSEAVATGTHGGTARLYRLDWSSEDGLPLAGLEADPQLLVDVVERPTGPSAFPGLYTAAIPDDGFVGPSTLLVNTQWGAVNAITAVDTSATAATAAAAAAGGEWPQAPMPLTPVEPGNPLYGNWSLMGVAGGLVVASHVAPDTPAELYVSEVPADPISLVAGGSSLTWRPLELGCPPAYGIGGGGGGLRSELPAVVQTALDNLEFRVLRIPPRTGDILEAFDCLLWMPRNRKGPLPAVLSPHGGPHTAVTLGWYPSFAALTALGYAVLCPNFRGSTGYGQAALSSLPGRIGRQDVEDCMAALEAAVEEGIVNPASVSVVGGSHGGFLTAHLLGQHPGVFRCGVMRNPVTNISAMVAASDIPDWCFVEVLGSEEGCRLASPVPSAADLAAMLAASPVSYVDAVTAPVFLMLGSRDRRVPTLDGLQYLSALRGRAAAAAGPPPPSRLIVFPEDGHGLDKPQTEFEQWINVMWWLKTYAGSTDTKDESRPSQWEAVAADAAADAAAEAALVE
ncbi:hypothetical protein VaNZ11_006269 [Volvox africanus]|uniref:acylaminoacyl-peptidase n=1 Tax=Volvox africanus TaxID=51714 RepID=A0ABQ5S0G2_9CHLO|nr:hypothetical protein VaNZ11_006269 [Volvox africanus]